jgi:hypothetical protein
MHVLVHDQNFAQDAAAQNLYNQVRDRLDNLPSSWILGHLDLTDVRVDDFPLPISFTLLTALNANHASHYNASQRVHYTLCWKDVPDQLNSIKLHVLRDT